MPKYTTGIQLEIILPSKKNIDNVKNTLNKEFKNNINISIDFNITKTAINKQLSQIRDHLKTNSISIPTKLNFNQGAINAQIQGIKNKLKNIGIGVGSIDLKTPTPTTKTDGYYKKEIETIIELDGTVKKTTRTFDSLNNIVEKSEKIYDKRKQKINESFKTESDWVNKLITQYSNYGKVVQTIEKKNAQGVTTGFQRTSKDEETGIFTTEYFKAGQESAYKIVNNIEKIQQAELKAQEKMREAILKTEQSRRKEYEKSELAQAKFINKVMDDEHKARQRENIRVERLGQKVTGVGRINFNADANQLQRYAEMVAGTGAEATKTSFKIDGLGKRIKEVDVRVAEGNKHWRNYKMVLDQTTGGLYKIDKGLSDVRNRQLGIMEQFNIAIKRIPIWMAGMTLFYGTFHKIQEGIQFISDLDREMVNLKKVTDETEDTYRKFTQTATQLGRELSKTTVEVVAATTEFAKMGYSIKESTELARTALLASNVGDIDVLQSTQYLIANVKAYNIEAEKSIRIIDVLNELQNNHATTVEVLGEGLKRTANSMQIAGASFEQTASMITAIQAVSQRGGEVNLPIAS